MEVMVSTYERRRFQTEVINELPLYPTEAVLWDENQVPDVHYTGTSYPSLYKCYVPQVWDHTLRGLHVSGVYGTRNLSGLNSKLSFTQVATASLHLYWH